MDPCSLQCLQCVTPISYHINPSHFHGLCEAHASSISEPSLICLKCESVCNVLYLRPYEVPKCSSCQSPANLKHDCGHLSCTPCRERQNKSCPVCVCFSCNLSINNFSKLCKTHMLCNKCSSKHFKCPSCFCQLCDLPDPDRKFPCGHPVCGNDCLQSSCKLCKNICSFCKEISEQLKGNHCKNHYACLRCFEEYVSKDIKRCNYCSGNYVNFQCFRCKKVSLEVEEVVLDGERKKICKRCQRNDAPEVVKKDNEEQKIEEEKKDEVKKNPLEEKKDLFFNECHFCQTKLSKSDSSNIPPCQNGLYCEKCFQLGTLDSCATCSRMEKHPCPICKNIDFLFDSGGVEICLICTNSKVDQSTYKISCNQCKVFTLKVNLNESFICDTCTGFGICLKCNEKKHLSSELCSECSLCEVCENPSKTVVFKSKCRHIQCENCMTSNTSKYCSKCSQQYKCRVHNQNFFNSGKDFSFTCCQARPLRPLYP